MKKKVAPANQRRKAVAERRASNPLPVSLDKAGLATTLFALRFLQRNYDASGITGSDHFAGESFSPLSVKEIDRLCELINTSDVLLTHTVKG